MIISRTPFRISFFGGGTDYPVWYETNGGAVLSTTIDKYCYITCRRYPPFFDDTVRVVWSKIELAENAEGIEHPTTREILKFLNLKKHVEVHHAADLPARSGLGASSSFTVGLLHALYAMLGREVSKQQLAEEAIHVERDLVKDTVGSQDQVAAAFGGFNKIVFGPGSAITVTPVEIAPATLEKLQDRLLLFFTGLSRSASEVAKAQVKNTPAKEKELKAMRAMVDQGVALLEKGDVDGFGRLLHESWQLKRGLSNLISTSDIDGMYEAALKAGALGGKLLGAGGGGFLLVYADPSRHEAVKAALKHLLHVPFKFENEGTQVIHNSGVVFEKNHFL